MPAKYKPIFVTKIFFIVLRSNQMWYYKINLTTSTAPALTFGSRPVTDMLAVNEPSMLKTTASVFGGMTAKKKCTLVWSPLKMEVALLQMMDKD